jgi:uncharacterized protein
MTEDEMEKSRTIPNIRRLVLDVDKAVRAPTLVEIAQAIQSCRGVEACNITVSEIDIETVGTDVTIEGTILDYEEIVRAIENTGAVVHGLNEIVAGDRIVGNVPRVR